MEPVFKEWYALTAELVDEHAPSGPAAVQLRRAEGLVRYPTGKSAMVFYFYASDDARAALSRLFADEIAEPGVRGQGNLWFRFMEHPGAAHYLNELFGEFVYRFGRAPILHEDED
jgi:hypothetical protein